MELINFESVTSGIIGGVVHARARPIAHNC